MTQPAPISFPNHSQRAALVARLTTLSRELRAEMAARARAEAEADETRELARDLQTRLAWAEADRARLLRALGSKLLEGAPPFVLAGLTAGFLSVLLLRWTGL